MPVFATLLTSALLFASGGDAPRVTHVRAFDPRLRAAIEEGARLSPSFRQLLDRLDASNVVVHIVYDLQPRHDIAAHLSFASAVGGFRYLRMFVGQRFAGAELASILGHELEHAVEIADRWWVVDQDAMRALYETIGIRRPSYLAVTFETDAAIAAGERVRREMTSETARTASAPHENR